jgi:hypothetical protein
MGDNGNDFWKKRYDSLLEGMVAVQERLAEQTQINVMLVMEKKQWEADKQNQGVIIAQAVNSANAISQAQGAEIQSLKAEIKRLKGE